MNVVIVGAGLGGLRTAQALRQAGYDGHITVAGAEDRPPYDRPPLSKQLLAGTKGPEDTLLAEPEELAALDLELLTGTTASNLDPAAGTVDLNGRTVLFDHLVIATGAVPRRLPFGRDLTGVHTLRTLDDSLAIGRDMGNATRLVVIGGGFIGCEVASSAIARGLHTSIVEMLPTPLYQALGGTVGAIAADLHRGAGVELHCGRGVVDITGGSDGAVDAVVLDDGARLPADLVVVGIGVVPDTAWLEGSGITVADGVVCDEQLRAVGHPNIRAVGDVARWHHPGLGRDVRVEHWTNAAESASHVAAGILGAEQPYGPVPYVWSDQHGRRIQTLGLPGPDDRFEIVHGRPGEKWVGLYHHDDHLTAAVGFSLPGRLMRYRNLLESGATWDEARALAAELEG